MEVLVFVVVVIGVLSIFFDTVATHTKQNRILYLVLCATVIILQMGLREGMHDGVMSHDTDNYYLACQKAQHLSFADYLATLNKDYGYYICNWVIAHVFKQPQVLFFIVAIVICFFTFRFIYKYSSNIYMSAFLFVTLGFFGFAQTGFRQTIAISICLWAYDFIVKKKFLSFLLITLLAGSMHQTAIIFIPMYFVGQLELNRKNVIIMMVALAFVYVFSSVFFNFFNNLFKMDYAGAKNIKSLTGRIVNFTIIGIIFVLLYLSLNEKNEYEKLLTKSHTDALAFSLMIGAVCYALQFKLEIMQRIALYYLSAINYVIIPNVIESFKDKKTVLVLNICFFVFSAVLFIVGMYRNNQYIFSYII